MTVTAFDDALSKLRQQARRRRMLRYKGPARPYKPESTPAYEEAIPATRTIVGDWSPDELGNRTRIIKGA
jgi:hypothetical protein